MKTTFSNSMIFSKEERESLKKLRIIQQNLIHVQGLPRSLNSEKLLESQKYFDQYGTIKNIILCKKINPENNKEVYSVYITYENEIQAAIAISCVDSLLIEGKIIRAFFGTTKYCNYFLNNKVCPNYKKCMFFHKLVSNKDIIIDDNCNFSYNEHLKLSKKIIELNNFEIKNILKKSKKSDNVLPSIDFIFLTEEQKEKYFNKGNISYVKSNSNRTLDNFLNNNFMFNNHFSTINIYNINNVRLDINKNNISEKGNFDVLNLNHKQSIDKDKYQDPEDLYRIFSDSINHILLAKPFFEKIRNIPLNRLEYVYLKEDLLRQGININLVLKGCLDCIKLE